MSETRYSEGVVPSAKRRKVRKGTRNCWECRRRKVRCVFASPEKATCDNCARRKTPCISQEQPEGAMPLSSTSSPRIEARLRHVEEIVEQFVHPASAADSFSAPSSEEGIGATAASSAPLQGSEGSLPRALDDAVCSPPGFQADRPPIISVSNASRADSVWRHHGLSHDLMAAWPKQSEIDLICTLPVGLSTHLHRAICKPYASINQEPPLPPDMLCLPPKNSHPVLIARKLLVLGTFIQGVLPSSIQTLGSFGVTCREIMSRVVETAIRIVTTNDELVQSIEGIECIMIEAQFQNYAGNLHRAWMAVRRATAVAQMMALHRGLKSPSLRFFSSETKKTFDPDHMCFRLKEMDCYLSLMLGLPPSSLEARFVTSPALEGCHALDRMQRLHCALAEHILLRKDADVDDHTKTEEIEKLLQRAAAEMPPPWWLIPKFECSNREEALSDTVRIMDQLTHYHLLLRLHLPRLLRYAGDAQYDSSRITAVNVSREILHRYVAFRTSNPGHFYCRGTDFLAFVAVTVLCLAHVESRYQHVSESGAAFKFLAHSRPSDRNTMDRVLGIIKNMATTGADSIASKLARVIRNLLSVESNAAGGTMYKTTASTGEDGELECDGKLNGTGSILHIYIPYFGAIDFERRHPKTGVPMPTQSGRAVSAQLITDDLLPGQSADQRQQLTRAPVEIPHSQRFEFEDAWNVNKDSSTSTQPRVQEETPCAADGWELEGVDIALFDSLFGEMNWNDEVNGSWPFWAEMA